ncbi:MAG TPA: hypothetical protein VIO14_05770 [Dehalococcoidia bacterium]
MAGPPERRVLEGEVLGGRASQPGPAPVRRLLLRTVLLDTAALVAVLLLAAAVLAAGRSGGGVLGWPALLAAGGLAAALWYLQARLLLRWLRRLARGAWRPAAPHGGERDDGTA